MINQMYKYSNGFININNIVYDDPIFINKEVRQKDVISPLLYLFFINPLIEELEHSGLGYQLDNNVNISVVAYCDDIMIVSDKLDKNLQRLLNAFVEWLIL